MLICVGTTSSSFFLHLEKEIVFLYRTECTAFKYYLFGHSLYFS